MGAPRAPAHPLIGGEPPELDLAELLKLRGQDRVIRNRELQLEKLDQGTEEALSLAERKVEDYADRQHSLDRDRGVVSVMGSVTGQRWATRRASAGTNTSIR